MHAEEKLVHDERVLQLQKFYKEKAPEKCDSADEILRAHAFRNVVHTLHEKYGQLPEKWEEELDAINWASSDEQGVQSAGMSAADMEAARVAARMKSGEASIWELAKAALSIGAQESYTATASTAVAATNVTAAGASAIAQSVQYKPPPMQTKKKQLLAYYAEHDPTKSNSAHVDNLLKNYPFVDLVRALKAKFGVVPEG